MESNSPVIFDFDDVPRDAVNAILSTIQKHGVGSVCFDDGEVEMRGAFKSVAGEGTFTHFGRLLTVTITRDNGHFSRLMIKGGLRQLVGEAVEQHLLSASPLSSAGVESKRSTV